MGLSIGVAEAKKPLLIQKNKEKRMEKATKEKQLTANGAVGESKGFNRYVSTIERRSLDKDDPRSFLFGTVSMSGSPFSPQELASFGIRDLGVNDEFDMPSFVLPHNPSMEQQKFIKESLGMTWLGTVELIPWLSVYVVVKQLPNKVVPIAACSNIGYHMDYRALPLPYAMIAYSIDRHMKKASLFLDILPEYLHSER